MLKGNTWPWAQNKSRLLERALARLMIGHVRLRGHNFRFILCDTEICECGEQAETFLHYLLECRIHIIYKATMLDN